MIGYVTLGTNDLPRAVAFYEKLMAELGATRAIEMETGILWMVDGGFPGLTITKPFNKEPATVGNGVMVSFKAKDEEQVRRLYDIALANGGTDEGPPGIRVEGFYAAYFRDLDGNKLNAFVMEAPETA